ncbi:hypothetical protein JAAARDRAFT_43937 [Jaapia argillacea MUCL 33604]|uniref:Uncharacterized protein n=1 Tax=Jaapia argillacea MUCL 33604 TaxID=933084 RepID=A0A067QR63_9AGAM|nr:hypothetical protein JAAARDRAFT_43937 [Jaapia argillacea MUCL 33604]
MCLRTMILHLPLLLLIGLCVYLDPQEWSLSFFLGCIWKCIVWNHSIYTRIGQSIDDDQGTQIATIEVDGTGVTVGLLLSIASMRVLLLTFNLQLKIFSNCSAGQGSCKRVCVGSENRLWLTRVLVGRTIIDNIPLLVPIVRSENQQ